jgi:chromosomal replication initiation ATPase DnaA
MILKSDIDKLADLCCRELEINIDDFYSPKRHRKLIDARRVFFYILKDYHKISEHYVEQIVPNLRNRTTIMHLNDSTKFYLKSDVYMKLIYKSIYEKYTKTKYNG